MNSTRITSKETRCPACNFFLKYGENNQWSKLTGIVCRDIYDGVLYWQCPNCQTKFLRAWQGVPPEQVAKWEKKQLTKE